MDVVVRDIGNSKGVIIPLNALKEAGIDKKATLHVKNGHIILQATEHPRAGWAQAIRQDPPTPEDDLLVENIDDPELLEEWTW